MSLCSGPEEGQSPSQLGSGLQPAISWGSCVTRSHLEHWPGLGGDPAWKQRQEGPEGLLPGAPPPSKGPWEGLQPRGPCAGGTAIRAPLQSSEHHGAPLQEGDGVLLLSSRALGVQARRGLHAVPVARAQQQAQLRTEARSRLAVTVSTGPGPRPRRWGPPEEASARRRGASAAAPHSARHRPAGPPSPPRPWRSRTR